ncbi:sensor histidine kinase [Micromonospora sp. HM5-17]|uniref:sensor histidine kinase n=1 Tax=Micromonospora sp. HM5-17 TaxID=2487710 RepID=UPI001F48C769|nr:histidine kinase [Micromonospora sp. HM5-17]
MKSGTGGVLRVALGDLRRLLVGPDYPPAPARWWRRAQAYLAPLLLLALLGLTAAGIQYLRDHRTELPAAAVFLLGAGSTLPAALAPFRPLAAWRIAYPLLYLGTIDAQRYEAWPWNPVQICGFLFVLILLATRASLGVAAWAGMLSVLPAYLFVQDEANAHGVTVLVLVILIIGDQVRRRRQSQRALIEEAERSELEQARRAVLEERTRIARELHDVVAHHMSMIAVQAETAPYRLTGLAEPARNEFAAIAGSAREALADMRRLLGVLRSESATPETAPQPGLAELPELVESARRAGMAVTFTAVGPPAGAEPPEAVALAAYRIIQEALANAARHAPGAAVAVSLAAGATALAIEVRNGPVPAPPDRPAEPTQVGGAAPDPSAGRGEGGAGPGHGLTGMRERARLLGGTLTAGPTDQGYAVTAHLPYRTENGV